MKNIFLMFVLAFLITACGYVQRDADGNVIPPNFQDGTWSSCTYSKDGRVVTPPPIQLGGAPMAWVEPDGTKVECKLIPKVETVK